MSRKRWFYVLFFAGLVAAFYLTLTSLIPDLGKKRTRPISIVRPFSFTDQDGRRVTEQDVSGKVYVAEFFFTTCRGICPRMQNNMKTVYEELRSEPEFLILSHTSDPDVDDPAVLKRYSDSLGVNTRRWMFLTGRKDSLYSAARLSYAIDDPENNVKSMDDDFIHTQHWALVDRDGNVRKIVDGLKEKEVKALIRDARKLLKR